MQMRQHEIWCILTFCGLAVLCLQGCALHYFDTKTGVEHLWGVGQLRMESKSAGNGLIAVATGVNVPGLCLEIGRESYACTFGYLSRQRLAVVSTNAIGNLIPPVGTPPICFTGKANSPWGIGHLKMCTVPSPTHHYAIVTGKALAGLGASAGSHDNSLGFVLDGRQQVVVFDRNVQLDFEQHAAHWPGFDVFGLQVNAVVPANPNQNNQQGEP